MRGNWTIRGLFAAASFAVSLTGAVAWDEVGLYVPPSRLVEAFDLPVVLPDSASSGPDSMLQNPLREVSGIFSLSDGFALQTGFNVDVGRILDRYAPSAVEGLFYSGTALSSPYLSLSSGGDYLGVIGHLSQGLSFSVGQVRSTPGLNRYLMDARLALAAMGGRFPYDYRATDSFIAGMKWDFARWGGFGLTASRTAERGLGLPGFPLVRTTALGVSARVGFGGGWVTTATYSEGISQLELRTGAFTPETSFHSEAYGVAVAKHGLFSKHDALGVTFARPAPNFTALSNASRENELQFFGRDKVLNMAAETDIELGYKTEFFGDSIALQANAAYQMNSGGVTGKESVSLLSRAKIKF
jgi:hypothetical protein